MVGVVVGTVVGMVTTGGRVVGAVGVGVGDGADCVVGVDVAGGAGCGFPMGLEQFSNTSASAAFTCASVCCGATRATRTWERVSGNGLHLSVGKPLVLSSVAMCTIALATSAGRL